MAVPSDPVYAKSFAEVRGMPTEDLVDAYDWWVTNNHVTAAPEFYLRELARRDQERHDERMLFLTRVVLALTVVNVAVVVVQVL